MLTELIYNRPFFPNSKYVNRPLRMLCKTGAITQGLCTNILFQIGGFNSNQINQVSAVKSRTVGQRRRSQFSKKISYACMDRQFLCKIRGGIMFPLSLSLHRLHLQRSPNHFSPLRARRFHIRDVRPEEALYSRNTRYSVPPLRSPMPMLTPWP
jgi:hypothetical protein